MTPYKHPLSKRLEIFEKRWEVADDHEKREFYYQQIVEMRNEIESDLAMDELLDELGIAPDPWTVKTDEASTIRGLINDPTVRVVHLSDCWIWGWLYVKPGWIIKYYYR